MKVRNLDRLKRRIAAMAPATREEIQKALKQSGAEIADMARALAPEVSGDLKRSIGSTIGEYRPDNSNVRGIAEGGGHDLAVTIHAGDAEAWYARLVEFGTEAHEQPKNRINGGEHPGASPTPFFYPAFRLGKKRAKSRISRAVKLAAKKAAGVA